MPTEPATQDDYFLTVGKTVQNTAIIDVCLFSAFRIISGCNVKTANAIYYALDALSAKVSMVNRVAKQVCDEEEHAHIKEIIKAAKLGAKKRNELAHAMVMNDPENKLKRFYPRHQTQAIRPITRAYLKSMVLPTGQAGEKARTAFEALCKKRGVKAIIEL